MLNVIGAKKTAVPVHASTELSRAVHFASEKNERATPAPIRDAPFMRISLLF
jgi:hypothetical protein